MTDVWHIPIPDEARTRLLAEVVATKVAAGDMITLRGDLGAGKTTFARYLIRALLGDDAAEVPSPTFTLLQSYETTRLPVRHFDLYRIASPDELHELEFDDADGEALTIVEWPERAADQLGIDKKLHARLFRHTAATHLNKVADIAITQQVLGHSHRANTLKYAHLNPDQYAAYMKKHPFMRKEPR